MTAGRRRKSGRRMRGRKKRRGRRLRRRQEGTNEVGRKGRKGE